MAERLGAHYLIHNVPTSSLHSFGTVFFIFFFFFFLFSVFCLQVVTHFWPRPTVVLRSWSCYASSLLPRNGPKRRHLFKFPSSSVDCRPVCLRQCRARDRCYFRHVLLLPEESSLVFVLFSFFKVCSASCRRVPRHSSDSGLVLLLHSGSDNNQVPASLQHLPCLCFI